MARGGSNGLAIDEEVAHGELARIRRDGFDQVVLLQTKGLAAQPAQPLDVELVRRQPLDALGLEHDDLASLRRAEIVSEAVDEEVVAGGDSHFDDVLAFMEELAEADAGAVLEARLAIVRGKPKDVGLAAHDEFLPKVENEEANRGGDLIQSPVILGDDVEVGDAGEPLANALPAGRDVELCRGALPGHVGQVAAPGTVGRRGHAVEGWLHRAGRDLERLQEESADAHGDGQGDQEHLDVLTVARIGVRLKPFIGGFFEFLHLLFQLGLVGRDGHRLLHGGDGGPDALEGLGREEVALVVEQFLHVLAHRGRVANGLGETASE